jgi:hypothetical protein
MGNNPEWANVFPAQKGFTGPDFGKNLVKTIERSKKKRDDATPTFDQFGDDIEEKNVGVNKTKSAYKPAVTKKPVAIGESVIKEADKKMFTIKYWLYLKDDEKEEFQAKIEAETAEEAMEKFRQTERGKSARKPRIVENVPPRPIVRQQDNPTEPQQTMKRPIVRQQDNPTEPQQTMKRPIVRQQDNPVREAQSELESIKGRAKSESKDCGCAQHVNKTAKGGYVIEDFFDSDKTVASYENGRTLNENYNKTTNESKMKRIKFKKPFNGVETALNVIPESYKVDNKVFEMTDGAEHYRVRWEGNLTEGKGVVLSSFHQEALNEDVSKIMHLMGFKSQDTLGNLKGSQRLTEDSVFFDMLKKSKESLNEAEAKPDFLDLDKDGDKKEPMKKAAKEANHEKSIEEAEMVDDHSVRQMEEALVKKLYELNIALGTSTSTGVDEYFISNAYSGTRGNSLMRRKDGGVETVVRVDSDSHVSANDSSEYVEVGKILLSKMDEYIAKGSTPENREYLSTPNRKNRSLNHKTA